MEVLSRVIVDLSRQQVERLTQVPLEGRNNLIKAASDSIMSTMQSAIRQGRVDEVLALFTGQEEYASSPVVSGIMTSLSRALSNQAAYSPQDAENTASALVPSVIGRLVEKLADPNDTSVSLQMMLTELTGGKVDFTALLKNTATKPWGQSVRLMLEKAVGETSTTGIGWTDKLGKMVGNLFGR